MPIEPLSDSIILYLSWLLFLSYLFFFICFNKSNFSMFLFYSFSLTNISRIWAINSSINLASEKFVLEISCGFSSEYDKSKN